MSFQDVGILTMCSWCQPGVETVFRPTGFRPAAVRRDMREISASDAQWAIDAGPLQMEPSAPVSRVIAEEVAVTHRLETVTLLMRLLESGAALRGFTEAPGSLRPV